MFVFKINRNLIDERRKLFYQIEFKREREKEKRRRKREGERKRKTLITHAQ